MKTKLLLLLFLIATKFAGAQYCGSSGSHVCSTTNIPATFGISDYQTFPCIHDSVAYSESLQLYFPDTVVEIGQHVPVYWVAIDSIVGLPCGMCWSCNDSTFTYTGGTRGCVQISGTTSDAHGAYQVSIYGRASTSFGTFPGNLDQIGFQFFLNVVGQHEACGAVDILNLHTPCAGVTSSTGCNFNPQFSSTPIVNCSYDSINVTVSNYAWPAYYLHWSAMNWDSIMAGNFTGRVDSMTSVFKVYTGDMAVNLSIEDLSSGCTQSFPFINTIHSGPIMIPTICYATTDSAQVQGTVKLVFERDNYFHNIDTYKIYRQDTMNQTSDLIQVGWCRGNVGEIIDNAPVSSGYNTYTLDGMTACAGDGSVGSNAYVRSVLNVDTFIVAGYPYLNWTNSNPLNYDQIYIFSRGQSGHWRLRYSSTNLSNLTWLDMAPDSTYIEYMLGYHINSSCDPSRSAVTAFSNFTGAIVTPEKVVPDTSAGTTTAIRQISSGQNVAIYPNPANDRLNVLLAEAGSADMSIYDMEGRLVMSQNLSGAKTNDINVSALAKGVYVINLTQNNNTIVKRRFLKQ